MSLKYVCMYYDAYTSNTLMAYMLLEYVYTCYDAYMSNTLIAYMLLGFHSVTAN